MIPQYKAQMIFMDEFGEQYPFEVIFNEPQIHEDALTDTIDYYAIYEGYEELHRRNVVTDILSPTGYRHYKTITVEKLPQ